MNLRFCVMKKNSSANGVQCYMFHHKWDFYFVPDWTLDITFTRKRIQWQFWKLVNELSDGLVSFLWCVSMPIIFFPLLDSLELVCLKLLLAFFMAGVTCSCRKSEFFEALSSAEKQVHDYQSQFKH
ncbi:hypothetical protein Pfo_005044 [Paulownia fortunei]|nr:hypothetical protein Pfo_005044 [Paulownia fortunei]